MSYLGYNENAEDGARKYYGKYKAFVRDNNDPLQRYRIRVYCPAIMGDRDDQTTWFDWALPCFPNGQVFVPPNGTGVWVECEGGDPSFPIWCGVWYAGTDPSSSELPAEAKTNYPQNGVIRTPGGIVVEANDSANYYKITHPSGTYVEIFSDGHVTVNSGAINLGSDTATHPAMLGDNYRTAQTTLDGAWETFNTAVSTFEAGVATLVVALAKYANGIQPNADPGGSGTYTPDLLTACTTFATVATVATGACTAFIAAVSAFETAANLPSPAGALSSITKLSG